MGFNKKYVSKESLDLALQNLNQILNADALIIQDEWSTKFIAGYQELIKNLNNK